jgi:uridine phosphorylase
LNIQDEKLNSKMDNFTLKIIELPTSKWKRLQYMVLGTLGHHALSLNAIIANRASGTFSADPYK